MGTTGELVPKSAFASEPSEAAYGASRGRTAPRAVVEIEACTATRAAWVAQFEAVAEVAHRRNPTQSDADRRLIAARLEGELEREDFRRHGWESALNARAIFGFWEEMQPGILDALPPLPPE